jgi:putative membrane protein
MKKLIFKFIFLSGAVLLADHFISGISVDGITTALIAGAILTLIQVIVKPIVKVLALPITILTLGLFMLIVNALFFWFVSGIVPGMDVSTFTGALLGSLIVSFLNFVVDHLFAKKD